MFNAGDGIRTGKLMCPLTWVRWMVSAQDIGTPAQLNRTIPLNAEGVRVQPMILVKVRSLQISRSITINKLGVA